MIRETLDGNSQNEFVFQAPAHGVVFQSRAGSTFTASASRDGVVWTQIGTAEISMSHTVFASLVTLSRARGSLGQSRFDNVEVRCP